MEVSTMSPLFTSPTNGPGQCEINVSSMAIHFVTLLVGVCGLVGNGAFLRLLQINAITEFVAFNHASINFLFLIFMVPSALLFLPEEVSCSAIMPPMYLSLLSQLSQFTYTMGLYQLMFISIERCRSILCLFFCTGELSEHLLWAFIYFLVGSWKRDCSMGSCWRHCSMESCRRYSSMQSLGEALQSVFEQPEENSASGNVPLEIMDTEA